jgi:hypothetical protein
MQPQALSEEYSHHFGGKSKNATPFQIVSLFKNY